jgi:hypothetical protein
MNIFYNYEEIDKNRSFNERFYQLHKITSKYSRIIYGTGGEK